MQQVTIEPRFEHWREKARELLGHGIPPTDVFWSDDAAGQGGLFSELVSEPLPEKQPTSSYRIPKAFFELAETVACHRDDSRWGLLYRVVWRLSRGGERNLLVVSTDNDVRKLASFAKEVRRDCHKMRAFVRFRKVGEDEVSGREQFVSWFEPSHNIVRYNASFFKKRFTGMDWSILTPDECVHWDGKTLQFSEGVSRSAAPGDDELEEMWRSYYKSIFNPARLKLKAMQSEMPVKYWKNLPEAPLINELTQEASHRRDTMIDREALPAREAPKNLYLENLNEQNEVALVREEPAIVESIAKAGSLEEMKEAADCCRACPLWERATQTVFGEGNPEASIMLIGEQPGDEEDILGRPFQGPAGRMLDKAMEKAGMDRTEIYITNVVKHFKWKPGAKRRLHEKANRAEMKACRPWLLGEIAKVNPKVIIVSGNTAAQALVRPDFKITKERGLVVGENVTGFQGAIVATVHPSYLLRIRDESEQDVNFGVMVEELKLAHRLGSPLRGNQVRKKVEY